MMDKRTDGRMAGLTDGWTEGGTNRRTRVISQDTLQLMPNIQNQKKQMNLFLATHVCTYVQTEIHMERLTDKRINSLTGQQIDRQKD